MAETDNKVLTGLGLAALWEKIKEKAASEATAKANAAQTAAVASAKTYTDQQVQAVRTSVTGAMHFKGTTTTALTDNGATPSGGLTIDSATVTAFAAGDVVINGSDEWVYGSDSKWHKFGNASGYLTDASAQATYVKKSSVAAKSTTLAYGQQAEVANIDGKSIKVTMPAAPAGTQIVDNLTSTSTTAALSANQGKALKGLIDGKAAVSHTHTLSQITDFAALTETEVNTICA